MTGFRMTSWPAEHRSHDMGDREPGTRHLDPDLLRAWREGLTRWESPPPVHAALERLVDPGTEVVVTGQQPGVWGGPLYCLYKAATAVARAQRLRDAGHPAVAVFWIGADDADWDEAGWGALPGPDLSLIRVRFESPLPSRAWIGDARLAVPAEAGDLLRELPVGVTEIGAPAPGRDRDMGDAFAACLLEVFGAEGLVPLDARWPEVRAAGAPLWRCYVDRHAAFAADIRAQGARLAADGLSAPIRDADSDHGLFVIHERRRAETEPAHWEGEVSRRLRDGEADSLAPSVLLRAPLQDYLLGTHTHVVGDGEAAYLRQLVPVYRGLGIPEPVRFPRLGATVLPPDLVPRDRLAEACDDPEAVLGDLAASRVPGSLVTDLRELREWNAARIAALSDGGRHFAKDLDQVAASTARKIDRELSRLDDVFSRRARQTLYGEEPRFRHLAEFLRPRRGPQERGLSALLLRLWAGRETGPALAALAGSHVDHTIGGAGHRFVLEVPHA